MTVNKIEDVSSFRWISDDFRLNVSKIAKRVPWFLANVHKDGYTLNKYNNTVLKVIY